MSPAAKVRSPYFACMSIGLESFDRFGTSAGMIALVNPSRAA
jgi:hypothetical protein